jgi:hypothetical protein
MNWNREFEEGLPDCRLTGHRRRATTVAYGPLLWERVYCGNCGKPGGLVTATELPHVFYVCDACVGVYGPLNMPELAADQVREDR